MKINLNFNLKDFILKKIGAERIFKYYYPGNFVLNKPCLSCFVDEKEPSMIIGQVNNSIIFKCFNSYHKGDCFTFVMNLFNLNFNDAIEKICRNGLHVPVSKTYREQVKETGWLDG